ncbi:NACHT domain-containing NTPase [Microcoleus sp. D2_18a_D3]|uniref:NACHT domain-containing NTPase n=1 Tax=Microcoleus sp. D2_18a_D3 TaxID=3055330 RepID=UPI002FD0086D
MDAKTVRKIFDTLPSKRQQVLLRVLAGESKAKIACDICDGSTDAVQQNLRQLYRCFEIQDERERKLPGLISLFAKSMPELIGAGNSQRINESQPSVYDDETWVGGEEPKSANPSTSVDREWKLGSLEDASEDHPDVLVQRVRSHPYHNAKIQDQCGQLPILDVERAVEIDNIYIDINVLEKLPSNSRKTISDFRALNSAIDKSDRLDVDKSQQEQVPGIEVAENNLKLMVLGKQGSGKTTFLNHLAIQCNQGRFQSQLIPIFIELKYFAMIARDKCNFSLFNYILDELLNCDVWEEQINTLLFNGRLFILLDGLDEVEPENADAVLTEISYFSKHYFRNKFVISCRIATQLANRRFSLKFTEVEVADFKSEQIKAFAKKWFVAVARNSIEQGLSQAAEFIKKLYLSEHQSILELAGTPILLNLACLVFQEKTNFPSTSAKLYEEGLDILLFRWDEAKNIKRDEIYRKLPVRNKKQMLSHVAAITFERGDEIKVFERDIIKQIIADGLTKLTDEKNAPVQVQLDSEAVLKSIAEQDGLLVERARGIYSFSHLTFQEYFTAWRFANSLEPQCLEKLVVHINEERWREVFLLTAEILPSADELMRLMKEQVDRIITKDEKMQQFFTWLNEKSLSVKNQDQVSFKLATVRSLYFAHEVDRFSNTMRERMPHLFKCAYALEQTVHFGSNNALDIDSVVYFFVVYAGKPKDIRFYSLDDVLKLKPDLQQKLEQLKDEIPEIPSDEISDDEIPDNQKSKEEKKKANEEKEKLEKFNNWFENDFYKWYEQLKMVTIKYRNIGHNWQFTEEYKIQLRQYYDANKLLVDCLNSSRNLSPTTRAHLEETFLLPIDPASPTF